MSEPAIQKSAHLHAEQIDGLIAAAGVEGARDILEAFRRSTTELLEMLDQHLADDAFDLAAQTAHAVKGSSANVGARRLAETAAHMEDACRRADAAALAQALARIREDFEIIRRIFEEHLRAA